jgi:drug/metabolite transporter (DMT)-like permease
MATPRHASRGYAEVLSAALINGAIGTMVSYATMPASMLVALRMLFGSVALGIVVGARRDWKTIFKPGARIRLSIAGAALALNLLSYFIAIRETGVAVAIFLSYLAPVYVALVAPRIVGGRTERVVFVALGVALAGMALILVPGLAGEGMHLTAKGLFFAVVAGLMYSVYLIVGKQLRDRQVHSTTIVFSMCVISVVLLTPLGLAQSSIADFTGRNLLMAALLGVLTTALSFSLIMDGMHHIPVQHASIMGYLEPVSAPVYALVLLSQVPSSWTVAGGALIIAAGVLVMYFGKAEQELLA